MKMLHQNPTTVPSTDKDHPEWHRGRRHYTLWLIDVRSEESLSIVEAAREHLSEFLVKPYARQPHITLFTCGFLTDVPRFEDDYGMDRLHAQVRLLKDAKIPPFLIEIGKLGSLSFSPFLEVDDPEGGIARVRTLLSAEACEIGQNAFMPHVTVGLYSGAFCSKAVGKRIASFSNKRLRIKVEQLTIASYDAQAISGELTYDSAVVLSS